MRLYVKLEVDYPDNARMIAAGEKAELLYIRALCLAKRTLSDGFIDARQIPRFGLPGWQARARKLVEVGLWTSVDQGYLIAGWADRNKSAEEIAAESVKRAESGRLGGRRSGMVRAGEAEAKQVASTGSNTKTETQTDTQSEAVARSVENPLTPTSGGTDPSTAKKRSPRAEGTSPRQIAAREAEAARPAEEIAAAFRFGRTRQAQGIHETEQDAVDDFLCRYPDRPDLRVAAMDGWKSDLSERDPRDGMA